METENRSAQTASELTPPVPTAPQTPPAPVPLAPRVPFATSVRERVIFPLLWLWCAFLWETLLFPFDSARTTAFLLPGLGLAVLDVAFCALLWGYLGAPKTAGARVLLAAQGMLALLTGLTSSLWFRFWDQVFFLALLPVLLFAWRDPERIPWRLPRMLLQRLTAFAAGLFQAFLASFDLFRPKKRDKPASRRWVWPLLGLGLAVCLMVVILPLLLSADALFSQLAGRWLAHLADFLGHGLGRLILGIFLLPMVFSLFYVLRRPERFPLPVVDEVRARADSALWLTAVGVLDLLYLFFLAVQSAALFGGAEYLERMGISYAEYARTGFFQLMFVVFLNLTVLLVAVSLSRQEGKAWRGVQVAGSVLIAESVVLLVSALWRMTLYVQVYGLTLKRILTYWGMAMAAVFLLAAAVKLWKPSVSFFRVLLAGSLAGWLALNLIDPPYLAARYNVDAYRRGTLEQLDAQYLARLSYDALAPLSELPGDTPAGDGRTLQSLLEDARTGAELECRTFQSWNLSAWLAARR